MTRVQWVDLPLGLGRVTPMTAPEVCAWILTPQPKPGPRLLANLNLHGAYLAYDDEAFRTFTRAGDLVLIDGWPILQLARVGATDRQKVTYDTRIGSSDWLEHLISLDPDILIVAVGGTPASSRGMAEYAARHSERLRWVSFDGYGMTLQRTARAPADGAIDDWLPRADLVLVGMGMPNQERWALDRLPQFGERAVVANVGGCFDYFSGYQSLAPRWVGRIGLEWLHRLFHSPRRLAGRYLWEPIKLVWKIVTHRGRRIE